MVHRIYIVEDHPITRIGYREMIRSTKDLEVCGESSTAVQALEDVGKLNPELVLIDVALPGMSGVELTKQLRNLFPELKMLLVSGHDESLYAERALRAGAGGYLMKHEAAFQIIHAIRRVLNGEIYISPKIRERILRQHIGSTPQVEAASPLDRLTDRELEVLRHMGAGLKTKEIAEQMLISPKTVEAHRAKIKDKLGLEDITEIIRFAIMHFNALDSDIEPIPERDGENPE